MNSVYHGFPGPTSLKTGQSTEITGAQYQGSAHHGYCRVKRLPIELVISLFLAIVSVPLLIYARSQIVERAESMLANGTRTYALIIEKRQWDYGRYGGQALVYKFTDRGGQEHIKSIDVNEEAYSSVQEGCRIEVIYDPADPTNSNISEMYEYEATLPKADFALVCITPIALFVGSILVTVTVKAYLLKLQSRLRSARGR